MEDRKRSIKWLISASSKFNLVDDLEDQELVNLGDDVVRTYEMDRSDRAEWDRLSETALKLAKQVTEEKSFPWPKAANVKYPLITVAVIQFAARAYPEIVKGSQVVKCKITGDDFKLPNPAIPPASAGVLPQMPPEQMMPQMPPEQMMMAQRQMGRMGQMPMAMGQPGQMPRMAAAGQIPTGVAMPRNPKRERSARIQNHMNYQLLEEMDEWDEGMDRLLHVLPVVGVCYKKTYRDEAKNVSDLVLPDDCVVNAKAKSLLTARRITHRLYFYLNDIYERVQTGRWREIENLVSDASTDPQDSDAPHEFLEQHRYIDLDGDGYKEPYIVTVHKQSRTVVRLVARWQPENVYTKEKGNAVKVVKIEPDQYFTHFGFIPNPDGSLNYLGFGQLEAPLNEAVNTILNQLIDAGTLSNAAGGFVGRGVKLRGGRWSFNQFEWKQVDAPGASLKENLVPLPVREPSSVLFQLLGFLVQAGKDISSVQDIMTGDAKLAANMPVGTIMALVEQGLKVFTAIYKRIYRSLSEEFGKLYKLNTMHVDPAIPYILAGQEPPDFTLVDPDYSATDMTVVPVADPTLSSDMQRMLKAQALQGIQNRPGLNEVEITRSIVHSIRPENERDILLTDEQISGKEPLPWTPPPNPQVIKAQANAELLQIRGQETMARLQMDLQRFGLEIEEKLATIAKIRADAILSLAKAEAAEAGQQMDLYRVELDKITTSAKMGLEQLKLQNQAMQIQQKGQQPGDGNGSVPVRKESVEEGAGDLRGVYGAAEPRAEGGPVQPGRRYVVGEQGPEVVMPHYDGIYDPQLDFTERVKEAAKLGVTPPKSADPADIMEYKTRVAPLLEYMQNEQYRGKGTLHEET